MNQHILVAAVALVAAASLVVAPAAHAGSRDRNVSITADHQVLAPNATRAAGSSDFTLTRPSALDCGDDAASAAPGAGAETADVRRFVSAAWQGQAPSEREMAPSSAPGRDGPQDDGAPSVVVAVFAEGSDTLVERLTLRVGDKREVSLAGLAPTSCRGRGCTFGYRLEIERQGARRGYMRVGWEALGEMSAAR